MISRSSALGIGFPVADLASTSRHIAIGILGIAIGIAGRLLKNVNVGALAGVGTSHTSDATLDSTLLCSQVARAGLSPAVLSIANIVMVTGAVGCTVWNATRNCGIGAIVAHPCHRIALAERLVRAVV